MALLPTCLRLRQLSAAVALVPLGLTACSEEPGASDSTSTPASTPPSAEGAGSPTSAPISVRERCGSEVAGARALSIATAAQQLYAVELGDGPRGVVLIHGSGSRGLCNWSAELEWMQDAGLHVLAYDQTCVGESTCAAPQEPEGDLRAAVSELKRRGAVAVIAIAASAGGPQAIDVASDPTSGVAAAVALSPVGPASSDTPRIPLLIAADPADTFVDLRSLRSVREAAPDLVNLEVVRGTGHAQQLLYDAARPTRGSALRKVMLAFVARHGGGR